ncbi:TPA: response regulator, partial [Candidatus Micrarchaeota archaeon]|nr:response regulator [Candidatus Micrarchaeota archaeon]
SVRQVTSESATLLIDVIDTGIGIDPSNQERIFGRFEQADNSTTRRFGGTGLGTAISKQLIELLGGSISLNSELGEGSCFRLHLPVKVQSNAEENGQDQASIMKLSDRNVLVISSDTERAAQLESYLSSWGSRVTISTTLNRGCASIANESDVNDPFSAIIVDQSDDIDPALAVHALSGENALLGCDLILSSPLPDGFLRQRYYSLGYTMVISQPASKTELYNALHGSHILRSNDSSDVSVLSHYRYKSSQKPPLRILLADDNPINQRVVEKILKKAGHHLMIVHDGEAALEKLNSEQYDLAIMDMQMPVMGGLEVIQLYHSMSFSEEDRVPFLVLSANATHEAIQLSKDAGAE